MSDCKLDFWSDGLRYHTSLTTSHSLKTNAPRSTAKMPMSLRVNPAKKELFEQEAPRAAKRVKTAHSPSASPPIAPIRKLELLPKLAAKRFQECKGESDRPVEAGHDVDVNGAAPGISQVPSLTTDGGSLDSSPPTEAVSSQSGKVSPSTTTTMCEPEGLTSTIKSNGTTKSSPEVPDFDFQAIIDRRPHSVAPDELALSVRKSMHSHSSDPIVNTLIEACVAMQEMASGQALVPIPASHYEDHLTVTAFSNQTSNSAENSSQRNLLDHANRETHQTVSSSKVSDHGRSLNLLPKNFGAVEDLSVVQADGYLAIANARDMKLPDPDFDVEYPCGSENTSSPPSTVAARSDNFMYSAIEGIISEFDTKSDYHGGLIHQPRHIANYQCSHKGRLINQLRRYLDDAAPKVGVIITEEQAQATKLLYKLVERRLNNPVNFGGKSSTLNHHPVPTQHFAHMPPPIKAPAGFKAVAHLPGRAPSNSIPAHYFQTFPNQASADTVLGSNAPPLPKLAPKGKRTSKPDGAGPSSSVKKPVQRAGDAPTINSSLYHTSMGPPPTPRIARLEDNVEITQIAPKAGDVEADTKAFSAIFSNKPSKEPPKYHALIDEAVALEDPFALAPIGPLARRGQVSTGIRRRYTKASKGARQSKDRSSALL